MKKIFLMVIVMLFMACQSNPVSTESDNTTPASKHSANEVAVTENMTLATQMTMLFTPHQLFAKKTTMVKMNKEVLMLV